MTGWTYAAQTEDTVPGRGQATWAVPGVTAAVALLIWVVRSRFLISWDSANFALGLEHLDIASHRPHPPGYVGYVLAGRAFHALGLSANDALIAANLVAVGLAGVVISRLARDPERPWRAVIAVLCLLCSPLVLFYASGAEIYFPELTAVTVLAWTAYECSRGRSPVWLALAFFAAALVKISSALFLLPLLASAAYNGSLSPRSRRLGLLLLLASVAAVAVVLLALQPNIVGIVWEQFTRATGRSRVGGAEAVSLGRSLNRNVRDTLLACTAIAGFNLIGLAGWLFRSRRVPRGISPRLLWMWAVPWLVLLTLIHIGKPGYALPLAPVMALLASEWYAGLGMKSGVVLASMAAAGNLLWFVFLPQSTASRDTRPYREKPFLARMASDLEPLSFPTRATILASDREVSTMLQAARTCRDGSWVVVAGAYGADWRRAMFYLPDATAIQVTDEGAFGFVGHQGTFASLSGSYPLSSPCGLLWTSHAPPSVLGGSRAEPLPGVGWQFAPGSGVATGHELRWTVGD